MAGVVGTSIIQQGVPGRNKAGGSSLLDLVSPAIPRAIAIARCGVVLLILMAQHAGWDVCQVTLAAALLLYSLAPLLPQKWAAFFTPHDVGAVVFDMGLAAALVLLTGGPHSSFGPVLYLPVLEAGAVLTFSGALSAGVCGALLVGIMGAWSDLLRLSPSLAIQPAMNFAISSIVLVSILGTCRLLVYRHAAKADHLQQNLKRLETEKEQLDQLAIQDTLTGLANRLHFEDQLARCLVMQQRIQRAGAIILLDLDGFQRINVECGHAAGDRVLQAMGGRIRTSIRKADLAARLGGDEFAVALFDLLEDESASIVVNRILAAVAEPLPIGGNDLSITACAGVSLFPTDGQDLGSLLKNAEGALLQAKRLGVNQFQLHTPKLAATPMDQLALERDLARAVEREEFILHYQPQVDLETRALVGVEALIRWNHPKLGLLPPGKFIGLAEESGQIVPLTEWVLYTACTQNQKWQAAGYPAFHVAVNLSARQFQRRSVIPAISRVLEATGLNPNLLEVEVTESAAMQDPEDSLVTLRVLKEMGVGVAMDDFGTGFSSLSYLKQFPFDTLKIDRSFIKGLGHDASSAAITSAVISLAQNLGLKVVAEGVETEEQLLFLRMRGCHQIQGYLISKPVPVEQLTGLLAKKKHSGVERYSPYSAIEETLTEIISKYSYSLPPAQLKA